MNPRAHPDGQESLGKYEILEEIGRGGYGVVYKGYDPLIKRHVALKTCVSDDSEVRQRFYREAEISGRLDHPNIVRIFDSGIEEDGTPYLVQEYLDGEDLDVKIETGFRPFPERLLYLIQIARGLAYAHGQGVIHRDVKPSNIRVLDDGTAKIMDFGIAKLREADRTMTRADLTIGTAAYLAPEQIEGDPVDHRTDLFAFGIVAYELLTGHLPFEGEKLSALFYQTLHQQPRAIRSFSPACPVDLERLVERCLEKRPERRIDSADQLLERLEMVRDTLRVESRVGLSAQTRALPVSRVTVPLPTGRGNERRSGPLEDLPLDATPLPPPAQLRAAQRPPRRLARTLTLTAVLLAAVAAAVWSTEAPDLAHWLDADAAPAVPIRPAATRPMQPAGGSADPAPAADPATRPTEGSTPEPQGQPVALNSGAQEEGLTPPEPPKAVLSFPGGWSHRIRVSVGGSRPMPLGSTLEVQPGTHLVTFAIDSPEYSASRTVRVKVAADGWRRVDLPLEPPGRLTVQAALGASQALVAIDGGPRRPTPIHGKLVSPGDHRITLFRTDGGASRQIDASITVRSREETVVTFDPALADPLVRRRPLPSRGRQR